MEYLSEKEVKTELIDILKKTDVYLRTNEYKYSIAYGSLLGAVRHGGFIPWDDDIDIAMLRPEYEKLIENLKKSDGYIGDGLYAVGYELGNDDWPFIKIVNKNIAVKEKISSKNAYLWVDIFCYDGLPREKSFYKLFRDKYYKVLMDHKRYTVYGGIDIESKSFASSLVHGIIKLIACTMSLNTVNRKYIAYCKRYSTDNSKFVSDMTWGQKIVPKSVFDDYVDYTFENIKVRGLKDYDTYLRYEYGDYMSPPPENERISHGIKAWRITDDKK